MISVSDDAGRAVALAEPARRIVSLVPSLTETLFALGCGDALIGVTRYCTEPAGVVERIERIGGTKNPDVGRIIALRPDLVLLNEEENRREDFEALERAGMNVFVSFSHRVRDVPSLIGRLGALAGSRTADVLSTVVTEAIAAVRESDVRPRTRVFCPIWKNPWMSFNRDTYAHDILWMAGGSNICADEAGRYPTITLEEVAARAPEIILLPDEPYVFREKDVASLEPLTETPACRNGRIHFIDGKALSWYGPRTAAALRYLQGFLGDPS